MAGGEFGEAGEAVGDALDGAEPHRPCADGRQKRRQHCCRDLVAPVAEEAGESHSEDGAVQPGLFLGSVGHEEILR